MRLPCEPKNIFLQIKLDIKLLDMHVLLYRHSYNIILSYGYVKKYFVKNNNTFSFLIMLINNIIMKKN